jgi:hypothetical protein
MDADSAAFRRRGLLALLLAVLGGATPVEQVAQLELGLDALGLAAAPGNDHRHDHLREARDVRHQLVDPVGLGRGLRIIDLVVLLGRRRRGRPQRRRRITEEPARLRGGLDPVGLRGGHVADAVAQRLGHVQAELERLLVVLERELRRADVRLEYEPGLATGRGQHRRHGRRRLFLAAVVRVDELTDRDRDRDPERLALRPDEVEQVVGGRQDGSLLLGFTCVSVAPVLSWDGPQPALTELETQQSTRLMSTVTTIPIACASKVVKSDLIPRSGRVASP